MPPRGATREPHLHGPANRRSGRLYHVCSSRLASPDRPRSRLAVQRTADTSELLPERLHRARAEAGEAPALLEYDGRLHHEVVSRLEEDEELGDRSGVELERAIVGRVRLPPLFAPG